MSLAEAGVPTPRRANLDGSATAIILLCCALWGLQQVAVKVIVLEVPPLIQCALRSLGAALLVWAWALWRNIPLFEPDRTLLPGILAGILFGLEFTCVYEALPHTEASRLVVFLYLAPFVVATVLPFFVPAERLNPVQITGLVGAFAALAYAFQEGLQRPSSDQLLGDSLAVLAAVLWGASTLVVRTTSLARASPEKTLLYQLGISALLTGAGSLARGEAWPHRLTPLTAESLVFQTVVVAFASYLAWFWLLRNFSATKVSAFSFLTPMFGLVFGSLVLHETLGPRIIGAMFFVALGIYLVNRRGAAAR